MFRLVNYYSGGEFQGKDLRQAQAFSQEGVAATAYDGVGPGQYYAGCTVTQIGATTTAVAPGRLMDAGQYYELPEDDDLSGAAIAVQLSSYLPLVQKKIVALCLWGHEIDTDVETRTVRLSLETPMVEFRGVPVRKYSLAEVEVVSDGIESAAPELPVIPDGLLHFCTVWLDPDGITKIEMVEANRLPNSEDIWALLRDIEAWKLRIEGLLETLREFLEKLRELLLSSAKHGDIVNMLLDVALLKQYANLPDEYVEYSADIYLDLNNSDPGVTGWDAQVDNGLLFPVEASVSAALSLLNPNDASVRVAANGLCLPAYTDVEKFVTGQWTGSDTPMGVSQATWEPETIELNTWVNVKGQNFNQYNSWWAGTGVQRKYGATYDNPGRLSVPSYPAIWWNDWIKNWKLQPVNVDVLTGVVETITGAAIAQTFMAPSTWVTQVELFLTSKTETDVSVFLCDVGDTGKPDFSAIYASGTVAGADLEIHPTGTKFILDAPVFLQAGKRYAIVAISDGVQRLATVEGSKYTQGTLFTSTSGAFFEGDLSKDLLFKLWGAEFSNPRTVVSLNPVSLAGGIADLKISLKQRIPTGCELEIQYQVNGIWHSFGEANYPLSGLPALVPLRAVFVGTIDVQPAMVLADNVVEASRAKLAFTHFSELRTLSSPLTEFIVRVRSHGFQQGTHALDCHLVEPDGTVHGADATTLTEDQDGSILHAFEFELGSGITEYRVRLTGTRPEAAVDPFVVVERIESAIS